MKILVTGGAGYIGTTLIPQLLAEGHRVRVLDNLMMGGEAMLPFFAEERFEFQKGDIRDAAALKKAFEGIDAVIHLAGIVGFPACRKYPKMSREINVDATALMLDLLPKSVPIVYSSTGSAYGQLIGDLCTETTPLNPLSDYGKQKMEAEGLIARRGNQVTYRFATAFGVAPRLRLDLLINDFTYRAVKEKTLIVYEKHFMRTFIHVRDMARSFVFALKNFDKMKGEVFNVGDSGQNFSKEQICLMIRKKVDFYLHFAEVGADLDQRNYMVSYDKVANVGFKCAITVDQGIDELVRAVEAIEVKTPFSNV